MTTHTSGNDVTVGVKARLGSTNRHTDIAMCTHTQRHHRHVHTPTPTMAPAEGPPEEGGDDGMCPLVYGGGMDMPYCAGALWGMEYPDMWAWSIVMGTMG